MGITVKLSKLALAALLVGLAAPAAAATYDFQFGSLLTGGDGVPTGGGPTWATMSIDNTSGTTYNFTLSLLNNFSSVFGSTSFVGSAEFNTDGTQGTIGAPSLVSGGVSSISLTNGSNAGSISWDFGDAFGGGQDRLTSGESVSWNQTFGSTLNLVSPFAALHVQGINIGNLNDESGRYIPTTPIPEPETYAMMLVGFSLLGFVARRRKQTLRNVAPA